MTISRRILLKSAMILAATAPLGKFMANANNQDAIEYKSETPYGLIILDRQLPERTGTYEFVRWDKNGFTISWKGQRPSPDLLEVKELHRDGSSGWVLYEASHRT